MTETIDGSSVDLVATEHPGLDAGKTGHGKRRIHNETSVVGRGVARGSAARRI